MKSSECSYFIDAIRGIVLAAGCAVLTTVSGCAGMDRRPIPTLDDIVQMSADGVSDDEIILQLKMSGAVYQLSASQIVDLSDRGVSKTVLDYMQKAYIENLRLMYGEPFWGYPC